MVYLVRQTKNLFSDGGDTMGFIAKVFKWIFKKLFKNEKKPVSVKIQAINSRITIIHKD